VPSFKRARTSLAQQHDLLGDQASGPYPSCFTPIVVTCLL
jgi:hypothetical protein